MPDLPMLAASRQMLLVLAEDWNSAAGHLLRFVRAAAEADWVPVGEAIPVSLGRSGLAWGRGLHPTRHDGRQSKSEGDGRAPAGVFAIPALFGERKPVEALHLPFVLVSSGLKCIDDPGSAHYNRFVDIEQGAHKDWASCEDMLRSDERYTLGAVVAHNLDPVVPGAGSCIFLHVWGGLGVPTAGCTAMEPADMRALACWLDDVANPVLVQLPRAEYEALREEWGLPQAGLLAP